MKNIDIHRFVKILREDIVQFKVPIVTEYSQKTGNPFYVLVSTILSLRTKDQTTAEASKKLLALANTPEKMLNLSQNQIEELIYPVGFYRVKAANLISICQTLIDQFNSQVPDNLEELLTLKGVGRKTANLVVTLGFNKPGICVDIHVHRISNRWGYIKTKTPEESEMALRKKLPVEYWIEYNDLLVSYGQNICLPVSPKCSLCRVNQACPKLGVKKSR